MQFTDEAIEEYIACCGVRCPACASDQIEAYGSVTVDGGTAHQRVGCLLCKEEWYDVYELKSVEGIE